MGNQDTRAAWEYHDRTKHSLASVRASGHALDWANQPLPFKIYTQLEPIALPRDSPARPMNVLEALVAPAPPADVDARLDLTTLARLLRLTAGVIRKVVYQGGREMYFRAAACTGALFHVDLYLACGALPGLDAGVYHFSPQDFALRRLRAGDHRAVLVEAAAGEAAVAAAPAVLICASTYWRNAWKYQARAYRHCFWDSGTMLANALAAAATEHLPLRLVLGFVDAQVGALLALDGEREAAVALLALGRSASAAAPPAPPLTPLHLETAPLSTREVDYPAIRAVHAASSLASPSEVAAWRARAVERMPPADRAPATSLVTLRPLAELPAETLDEVILRRGSTRAFARRAIDVGALSTLLRHATGSLPADFLAGLTASLADVYVIVNAVEGLAPGAYVYHRELQALELLRPGDHRQTAGFLDLGQELAADASVNVYMLADLHDVLARLGNRGYRAAQLESAIVGGRLYLGAYALRLGATGLTFFDDDVTEFFSPHAGRKSVMFLMAVGRGLRSKSNHE